MLASYERTLLIEINRANNYELWVYFKKPSFSFSDYLTSIQFKYSEWEKYSNIDLRNIINDYNNKGYVDCDIKYIRILINERTHPEYIGHYVKYNYDLDEE